MHNDRIAFYKEQDRNLKLVRMTSCRNEQATPDAFRSHPLFPRRSSPLQIEPQSIALIVFRCDRIGTDGESNRDELHTRVHSFWP
jgi:hypothetical protein